MRSFTLRFSLRTLLVLVTLCAVGIAVPYWIPKSQKLSIHESYIGYYRGLGHHSGSGYFGKNWYLIVVDEGELGRWKVDVNGIGYNNYQGYYSNGAMSEVGECMVFENANDIAPDRHDILHGKYYSPEGELVSEIRNGTGKQMLFFADGNPHWELHLVNGQRARVKMWYPNGQLVVEEKFVEGRDHGKRVTHHPNGQIKVCGEYASGKRIGIWRRYNEDGSLKSETNYDLVSE